LGMKEVQNLKPEELIKKVNEITGYEFEVHYCGKLLPNDFSELFVKQFAIPATLSPYKGKIEPERMPVAEQTILLVNDKKAVQSHINIFIQGTTNDEASRIEMAGFNDYMDGGMSSIIFQEIREFRSLAYGTSGN
jgi:zinc protease